MSVLSRLAERRGEAPEGASLLVAKALHSALPELLVFRTVYLCPVLICKQQVCEPLSAVKAHLWLLAGDGVHRSSSM
jgi:hypothetical protein